MSEQRFDLAIVGAGAAGLMTGIWASRIARAARPRSIDPSPSSDAPRIAVLDGARRIGAKILIAGGGRCNVTHEVVDEKAFAGSTRPGIRKVLRRFGVPETVAFFRDLGVELKREETGKLFPVTDSARTVLTALLRAASDAGVEVLNPWRVERIERVPCADATEFVLSGPAGRLRTRRLVLATGGKSLPKTGSDGGGYALARALGHTITDEVFPALVALTLPPDHFLCALAGTSAPVEIRVHSASGRLLVAFTGAALCTHFGLSGPAVLDVSRYLTAARHADPSAHLRISWLPPQTQASVDHALRALGSVSPGRWLRDQGVPQRLALALCAAAGVAASEPAHRLARADRASLVRILTDFAPPITGDRGFAHAEVTAGGVPLSELVLETMESRLCPGLFLVGEICDVDGRIGGFNFQWAWSSGQVAGSAIGRLLCS